SAGQGAAALFLDQQRPLVAAGRIQGICAWCSGEETGRGEFLSGGFDKTTIWKLAGIADARAEGGRQRLLHGDPLALGEWFVGAARTHSDPLQPGVQG